MSSPCPLPRLRHGEVTSDGDDDDYVQLTLCFIRSTSSVVKASDFDITGITFTCFVATIHNDNPHYNNGHYNSLYDHDDHHYDHDYDDHVI